MEKYLKFACYYLLPVNRSILYFLILLVLPGCAEKTMTVKEAKEVAYARITLIRQSAVMVLSERKE